MSLTKEEVTKVARLARLKMSDNELEEMLSPLNRILGWVEQLSEVDTDNVEPLASTVEMKTKFREDVINDGNYRDDILANAPETLEGFFVVPKVVE